MQELFAVIQPTYGIRGHIMNSMHLKRKSAGANDKVKRPVGAQRQRGASLLEAIAYLGVAAVVVLGAVSLLNGAFGSAKSNQTSEELVSLRTAARKLYLGQTYPAAMNAALISAGAAPATLVRGEAANSLINSWGGAVTVAGAGATFTITYAGLPRDVCMNVISGATGWTSIGAGANAITVFPATAANATAQCGADANNIVFTAS
jgi:PilS N terminal